MMRVKSQWISAMTTGTILLVAVMLLSGCSVMKSKKGAPSAKPPKKAARAEPKTLYYDFGDVLLPSELKIDTENSFVFRTPGITAGVLSLKGRVDLNSLITFFENKMPVDGWQAISAFKAPRTMMLFKKQTRWCVISITESQFNMRVEIWVAPTVAGAENGLKR